MKSQIITLRIVTLTLFREESLKTIKSGILQTTIKSAEVELMSVMQIFMTVLRKLI